MKKNIQLAAMLSAAVILICVLIPTFVLRVKNEAGNKTLYCHFSIMIFSIK